MTRSRPFVSRTGRTTAGLFVLAATLLPAQTRSLAQDPVAPGPALPELFRPIAGADPVLGHPALLRSRAVAVDVDLLRRLEPADHTVVRIELFPELAVNASFERIERRGPDDFTWYGSLPGTPDSSFILTVYYGSVAGGFFGEGEVNSVALQTAPGMQVLRQWDPARFRCGARGAGVQFPVGPFQPLAGCSDDGRTLRILVAYTPRAEGDAGGTAQIRAQCQYGIDTMNRALANSKVDLTAVATRFHRVSYTACSNGDGMNGDLDALHGKTDGYMDEVHGLRDQDHADTVVLVVEDVSCHGSTSGVAYVMGTLSHDFESSAFAVCEWTDMWPAFAHEVGHNLGCGHDAATGGARLYSYSQGYQWFTLLTSGSTVMAYADTWHPYQPYFSTPNVTHNGVPVGAGSADNAFTISLTRYTACNWRLDQANPIVLQNPSAATICAGNNERVMEVIAINAPTRYQWRRNGLAVTGKNTPALSFANAVSTDAGSWDCVIDNACGTTTTSAARLTVNSCGTLYVDAARPFPGGDGLSWAGAHTELYTALDRAVQLGTVREVRVAQGTYRATRRGSILQRDYTHRLPSDIAILGGYPTGGAAARDATRWPVIIDGELQSGVFGLHVFHALAAKNVVLDGLTIQNGSADVPNALDKGLGGGLYMTGGSIALRRCTLRANQAIDGAAVYVDAGGTLELTECKVEDNRATGTGGAVFARSATCNALTTHLRRNQSATGAGGLQSESSIATLVNCTFERNGGTYGALHASFGITNATNCTVSGNVGSGGAGGFDVPNGGLAIINSVLWNNAGTLATVEQNQLGGGGSGTVTFTCIQGLSAHGGAGNIGLDPLFAAPQTGDFHLRADSPCVNAGTTATALPATDFEGDARIDISGRVDLGVDENTGGTVRPFGIGCAGGIQITGKPELNEQMTVQGWSPYGFGTLFLGFDKSSWAGLNLPFELGIIGSAGCYLNTSLDVVVASIALPTGAAQATGPTLTIPNMSALVGAAVYFQWHFFRPGAPYLTSNGMQVTFGY